LTKIIKVILINNLVPKNEAKIKKPFIKVVVATFLIMSSIFKFKKLFQFACGIFFVSMVCSNLEGFMA